MDIALELYDGLVDFMHWLAWKNVDDNKALMNHEDIFGELQVEFVKSLRAYGNLPTGEFMRVTKRMFDNRISELKHKYYGTHRGIPGIIASIDATFFDEIISDGFVLEDYIESKDFVEDVRNELCDGELEIFDMIVYGDERLTEMLRLVGMRSSFVYSSRGTVRIKAWHIADVLSISVIEARRHLSTIEKVVRSKL